MKALFFRLAAGRIVLVVIVLAVIGGPSAAFAEGSRQQSGDGGAASPDPRPTAVIPPLVAREATVELDLDGRVSTGATASSDAGELVPVNAGQPVHWILVRAPAGRQRIVLPVQLSAGRVLAAFSDPALGIDIAGRSVSIELRDSGGALSGVIDAEVVSVSGGGAFADVEIGNIRLRTAPQSVVIGGDVGTASVAIEARMTSLDLAPGALLKIVIQDRPDARARTAFQDAAAAQGFAIEATAYAVQVEKTGVEDGRHIASATIEMKVGPASVIPYGVENMWIVRQDDTGAVQFLPTRFVGLDSGNNSVFRADTPDGLSVFALMALRRTVDPTPVPSATPTPATPAPTPTPPPEVDGSGFDANIGIITGIAAAAIAVFFGVVVWVNRRRSW